MDLAASLFKIQRGTKGRIATLQAHFVADPQSKGRQDEVTKELSGVLATAGFREVFLKGLVKARANYLARKRLEVGM